MQNQDYTVEVAIDRKKPDNFGNQTYDVKFEEYEQMVYVASKTPLKKGDKKYGHIEQNEYGFRFKSEKKMDGPRPAQSYTPKAPKKSDDERSEDIRWGLCIKEANAYITKYEEGLSEEQWADAVNRYANALYKVSHGPDAGLSNNELNDMFDKDSLPL